MQRKEFKCTLKKQNVGLLTSSFVSRRILLVEFHRIACQNCNLNSCLEHPLRRVGVHCSRGNCHGEPRGLTGLDVAWLVDVVVEVSLWNLHYQPSCHLVLVDLMTF